MNIHINHKRDDNIRPIPHQVVGFTTKDIFYFITVAVLGTAALLAVAIAIAERTP